MRVLNKIYERRLNMKYIINTLILFHIDFILFHSDDYNCRWKLLIKLKYRSNKDIWF